MCGIAGFLDFSALAQSERVEALSAMGDAIRHRGPDDDGIWFDHECGIGFAHRRLSILDLSPAGHQPMASPSGRFVIVFNGEIYNFQDLRRDLEALGHKFRGSSDTEVILHAIEAWGLDASLKRFVGMFALAVWDRDERLLHLARDRMGEKPLYYAHIGETFLFGSELKALRAHPAWRGSIDRGALNLYFQYSYFPAPYTIYTNTWKLPPSSHLVISEKTLATQSGFTPEPYWSLQEQARAGARQPFEGTPDEAVAEVEALLRGAIRGQMLADVPVGTFLSGGIDSSTIAALMQAESQRPIKTFTIGFHEDAFNEADHARSVASCLGTDHTEFRLTTEEARGVIPKLPAMYDEPLADVSQIPTYLVARLARQSVTVSLSGDGGDELFGGYLRYRAGRELWRAMGWLPLGLRRAVSAGLLTLPPATWDRLLRTLMHIAPRLLRVEAPGDKLWKLARLADSDSAQDLYIHLLSNWEPDENLVIGSCALESSHTDQAVWTTGEDFTSRMMLLDASTYLPDDILVKVDRASMATSLESRVPFLDHRVVEFALGLPSHVKYLDGSGKWPVRQILARHVDRRILERPKMGFGVPIGEWLRGPLRDWAQDLLSRDSLRSQGYLSSAVIERRWREHLSGERNWHYQLWAVLMFQAWLEEQLAGA